MLTLVALVVLAQPPGPSPKARAAADRLRTIGVNANPGGVAGEAGWDVSLAFATDYPAAKALVPDLELVRSLRLADKTSDADLAAFAALPGLEKLDFGFGDAISDAGMAGLKAAKGLKSLTFGSSEARTPAALAVAGELPTLVELRVNGVKVGPAGLAPLANLKALARLAVSGCDLSDADVRPLAGLTGLTDLNLGANPRLSAAGLAFLAGLTKLERLNLDYVALGDDGARHLAGLTALKDLDLSSSEITDAALASLAGLTKLERLSINNTEVSGEGFKSLAGLTRLRDLGVNNLLAVTGEGLEHFANSPALTRLDLTTTGITDAGLAKVKALKQVRYLSLPYYGQKGAFAFWANAGPKRLTDVGLGHVAEMTNLEVLSVSGKGVTDAGIARLGALTKLVTLTLGTLPNVHGPGFAALKACPKLYGLNLENTRVADADLKHLAGLTLLRSLSLPAGASDACVPPLKGMTNLFTLRLPRGVSKAAAGELKAALPRTDVSRESDE